MQGMTLMKWWTIFQSQMTYPLCHYSMFQSKNTLRMTCTNVNHRYMHSIHRKIIYWVSKVLHYWWEVGHCMSVSANSRRVRERLLIKADALFKPAFRLFQLCLEVIWVDVTSHSNNKGFHLLTFSSWLLIGKQIVWLWIFMPSQQRFSFWWVFKEAIPSLIPDWLRWHVLFLMKDANPQQSNEIQSAMKNIFIYASKGTCEYHLVNIG